MLAKPEDTCYDRQQTIALPKDTCHDRRHTMALHEDTCPVPLPTQPLSLYTQRQLAMAAAGASLLFLASQV